MHVIPKKGHSNRKKLAFNPKKKILNACYPKKGKQSNLVLGCGGLNVEMEEDEEQ